MNHGQVMSKKESEKGSHVSDTKKMICMEYFLVPIPSGRVRPGRNRPKTPS